MRSRNQNGCILLQLAAHEMLKSIVVAVGLTVDEWNLSDDMRVTFQSSVREVSECGAPELKDWRT